MDVNTLGVTKSPKPFRKLNYAARCLGGLVVELGWNGQEERGALKVFILHLTNAKLSLHRAFFSQHTWTVW